jgi:valyl-tRNA synthetase
MQISFVSAEEGAALTGQKGQIELVVQPGLEAFLPMAGLFDAGAFPRSLWLAGTTASSLELGLAVCQQCTCGHASNRTVCAFVRRLEHALPAAPCAAKEIERLAKQRGKLEKELAALQGRLSNPKFVDKAPEKVVAEAQQQAAEMQQQLAMIDEKVAKFQQLA